MMILSSDVAVDIERLEELIVETGAFRYSPDKPFQLASGRLSDYYFDLKKLHGHPEGINIIAKVLYHKIKEMKDVTSVGGLEYGSISIATAISQLSYLEHEKDLKNPIISSFFVRKAAKEHGSQNQIEGILNSPVVVIDDVITSGDSAIQAVKAVQEKKYDCKRLLSVVFRGNDEQKENVKKICEFEYIFTEKELVAKFTKN